MCGSLHIFEVKFHIETQIIFSSLDLCLFSHGGFRFVASLLMIDLCMLRSFCVIIRFFFPALGGLLYGYEIGATSCATISLQVKLKVAWNYLVLQFCYHSTFLDFSSHCFQSLNNIKLWTLDWDITTKSWFFTLARPFFFSFDFSCILLSHACTLCIIVYILLEAHDFAILLCFFLSCSRLH